MLRQLAYMEGTPLVGPDEDRDGWETLPAVHVRGTIFSSRKIGAVCTVCLVHDSFVLPDS